MERIARANTTPEKSPYANKKGRNFELPPNWAKTTALAAAIALTPSYAEGQAQFRMPGNIPGTPGISDIGVPGIARLTYAQGIDINGTWTAEHTDFQLTRDGDTITMTQLTGRVVEPLRNNGMYVQPDGKGGLDTIEVDVELDNSQGGHGPTADLVINGVVQWSQIPIMGCVNKGPFSLFHSQNGIGINQGYNGWNAYTIDAQMDCFQFETAMTAGLYNAVSPNTNLPLTNHFLSTENISDGAYLYGERVAIVERNGGRYMGMHFALPMGSGVDPLYVGLSNGQFSTTPDGVDPNEADASLPDGTGIRGMSSIWAAGEIPLENNPSNPIVLTIAINNSFRAIERTGDPQNPLATDTIHSVNMSPFILTDIQSEDELDYDEDGQPNSMDRSIAMNTGDAIAQATCFKNGERDVNGATACISNDLGFEHASQRTDGAVEYHDGNTPPLVTIREDGRPVYEVSVPQDASNDGDVVANLGWQKMKKARVGELPDPIYSFATPPEGFAYNLELQVDVTNDLHGNTGSVSIDGAEILSGQNSVIDTPTNGIVRYELEAGAFKVEFNGATFAPHMRVTLRVLAAPDAAVIPDASIVDAALLDATFPDASIPDSATPDAATLDLSAAAIADAADASDVSSTDAVVDGSADGTADSNIDASVIIAPVPDAALHILDAAVVPEDAAPQILDAALADARVDAAILPTDIVVPSTDGAIVTALDYGIDGLIDTPDLPLQGQDMVAPQTDSLSQKTYLQDMRSPVDANMQDQGSDVGTNTLHKNNEGCSYTMRGNSPTSPLIVLATGILAARRRRR